MGDKVSLNAPYFNRVNGPIFVVLLILMGVAPLLAWRRSGPETLRKNFLAPLIAALISAPLLFALGNRTMGGFVGVGILVFVFTGIVQEYVRGVRARRAATGEALPVALVNLVRRNGRRYGGYIVHIGILLIALGIIGHEFYQSEQDANLAVGQSVKIANYEITYAGLSFDRGPNYDKAVADMRIVRNGRPLPALEATKLFYDKNPEQPMTEVGLRPGPIEDVYVVLAGYDSRGATASFKMYINPLMSWMWIGGVVMILGVLVSAWPRRSLQMAEAAQRAPAGAQPAR
jgi:cytochrome c-type biogenesis protein CcmF